MKLNFGGIKEEVITRKEFPMTKAHKVLKDETIAIIGYGVQGPAQALNLKDNGFKVIIGQSQKFAKDWNRAKKDGWDLRGENPSRFLFVQSVYRYTSFFTAILPPFPSQPFLHPSGVPHQTEMLYATISRSHPPNCN